MTTTPGDLSQDQGWAFIAESESARNLLGYGVHAIRTARYFDPIREPVLTLLSIGMEKLHKLALGLLSLDRSGTWLSRSEMTNYGHNLRALHDQIMEDLTSTAGTSTSYVGERLHQVATDPVIPPLIDVLSGYGSGDRFYNLDQLALRPKGSDPAVTWRAVEQAVRLDPAVDDTANQAIQSPSNSALWDTFYAAFNTRLADSVERLWTTITDCGNNGLLGSLGRQFGATASPTRAR